MLKARNIIIILVVNYIVGLFVSGIIELNNDNQKAKQIMVDMRTAGSMALQQTQTIDAYIRNPSGASDQLDMPSTGGGGFVPVNVFSGLYNLDTTNPVASESLYQDLYGGSDFKSLASRTGKMTVPVQYFDPTTNNPYWYYIPKVAELGTDMLQGTNIDSYVTAANGSPVSTTRAQQIFSAYRMTSHTHVSNGVYYYNTPLSSGITYLNPHFLSMLFENNMDLLMRLKYNSNLNTTQGGNGVYKGFTYSNRVKGDLSGQNPINNGSFTYLRGNRNYNGSSTVQSFDGVAPSISYKVIDMYNSANDPILIDLFGAYRGSYATKAAYLKSLDSNAINPVTGAPFTSKPIVVAKVTFYADVIVPYATLLIRNLRSLSGEATNFLDIKPNASDVAGPDGSRRMQYTTYFAVTP